MPPTHNGKKERFESALANQLEKWRILRMVVSCFERSRGGETPGFDSSILLQDKNDEAFRFTNVSQFLFVF